MYPNSLAVKASSASTLAQVNNRGSNHTPTHRQRLLRPMNPTPPSARDGGFGRHGVRSRVSVVIRASARLDCPTSPKATDEK